MCRDFLQGRDLLRAVLYLCFFDGYVVLSVSPSPSEGAGGMCERVRGWEVRVATNWANHVVNGVVAERSECQYAG